MGSFIIWDMSSKADGVWKNVEADDARTAAEQIYGKNLRSVGTDTDICLRVRSLDDPSAPATLFYGQKSGQAARELKKYEELRAQTRHVPAGQHV
jgi:hypothetical protein